MRASQSPHHRCERSEVTCAYALQALPSGEIAAAEAHIAACADCRHELESLRPVVDSFVSWPTDLLRQTTSLQAIGESALPQFRAPFAEAPGFPLTLTSAKTPLYCHSQHRNLARLRRLEPDPVAELSPATAATRGVREGDWIAITTPRGGVRARAWLNAALADGIVAAGHGWWQACPELDLPGYDAIEPDGANINLAIGTEAADPVSGAAPHRCYPCQIERLA